MKIRNLLPRIKILLADEASRYADDDLIVHLEMAAETINRRRGYNPLKSTQGELEDIHGNLCVQMAICAINKMGAEGENAHTEGNTTRTYGSDGIYPVDLLAEVVPLIGIKRRGRSCGH